MLDLGLCLAALVLGPLVYQLTKHKARTYAFFDGLVLVGVGGLVLVEVLPGAVRTLGIGAIPVAVFGFVFPYLLESRLNSLPVSPRTILSGLIVLGLILHQLLDGVALNPPPDAESLGHAHELSHLSLAIVLHQLPKGFFLWDLARKAKGDRAAFFVLLALVGATATGFLLGTRVLPLLHADAVHYFQAFIAGGLLHVVFHHVPGTQDFARRPAWSGAGALAALTLFFAHPRFSFLPEASAGALDFKRAFYALSLESAPPILLGLLAAGFLQAFVPRASLRLFRGRTSLSQALRGIVLGMPLPICSCGVTALYHTLVRRGVPAGAAIAFLISTPEIGFDSVFLSLKLLGTEITLLRLGMAFLIAILTACILGKAFGEVRPPEGEEHLEPLGEEEGRGFGAKLKRAFRFGCVEMVDHIGAWLVAGLVLAAALEPYLDAEWVRAVPRGVDILVLSLCGLPIYVCASGATPLAAVLLEKTVSPGAVLAFLITGPATNVTTFGILSRLHGLRRAALFALTVFALSVLLGFGVNAIAPEGTPELVASLGSEPPGPVEYGSAALLVLLLAGSVLRLGPRGFLARLGMESREGPDDCHACPA